MGHGSNLKWLRVTFIVAIIVLTLTIMILGCIMCSSIKGYGTALYDFKENWETRYLVDIAVSHDKCPEGYENLIDRQWPGTEHGCDCSRSYKFFRGVQTGHCDKNETRAGCVDVWSNSAIPLEKFYSYRLCGKREGEPFHKAERPSKKFAEIGCQNGYRLCGTGKYDTQTCIPTNQQCPINDIKLLNLTVANPEGYSSVNIGNDMKIAFTSTAASLPIVRLKLTEGKVCANPSEYEKSNGRHLYVLLRGGYGSCSSEIGDEKHDPRYTEIGSIREDRLFDDNGVTRVTARLPKYPDEDARRYFWNLYTGNLP